MNIYERAAKIPHIDFEQVVYRLVVEDAISLLDGALPQKQLDKLTDTQLDLLIHTVCDSFNHLEWVETGEAGYSNFKWDNRELFKDDSDSELEEAEED